MIYKILNKLFGWDYVYWGTDWYSNISRVHTAADATIYYWSHGTGSKLVKLTDPSQVVWMTCSPDKYFKADK